MSEVEQNSYAEVTRLRKHILKAALKAKEGHIASAFSILDVLYVLYSKVACHFPDNPQNDLRDRIILSKGHGCLALYAVLADQGYFPIEELETFCKLDSKFGGHPDRLKVPGVEASTGSLGHGLPIAVGMAYGLKLKGRTGKVYCIVGDGELNEGSNWEAMLLAIKFKLDNLTVIVDYNRSGDRAIEYQPFLTHKFSAFGFSVEGCHGHDHGSLEFTLAMPHVPNRPKSIIINTVKGKGVREMEDNPAWHHRAPTPGEYDQFIAEMQ